MTFAAEPATAPAGDDLEVMKALAASGRHAEALQIADRLCQKAGHGWSLSFNEQPVHQAFLGQSVGYFSVLTGSPKPPTLSVRPEHMPREAKQYGWLHYVTAVDLDTGKALWTRCFVPHPRIAIDPRDDSLWVWNEREGWFEQINPTTAETIRRGEIPGAPVTPGQLECLLDGEVELWARTSANTRSPAFATRYDLSSKELRENWPRHFARSPGGLRTLTYTTSQHRTTFTCSPMVGGNAVWTFDTPGATDNPPTWIGRDALLLAGGPYVSGALYRVNGETGKTLWQTSLDAFAYAPKMVQLRGGSYASGGWLPFGECKGEVWAIDWANRLHFFDADTGEPTRVIEIGAAPLAPPAFENDASLTLATVDGFNRTAPAEKPRSGPHATEITAVRIRCLMALNKRDELQKAIRTGVGAARSARDWGDLAAALESQGDLSAGVAARVEAMILANQDTSPALRRSHGLVARLPSGPTVVTPVPSGPVVLVATKDGTIRTIDPSTATEVDRETIEGGIGSWHMVDARLVASGVDGLERQVREFARPPSLPADDPLYLTRREQPLDAANVDRQWYTAGGGIGAAQRVDGRLVRPMKGGAVRELVKGEIVDRPGELEKLNSWRFAQVDRQWLAIGESGVYVLDDELRPTKQLIKLDTGRNPAVWRIAGDANTIGITVRDGIEATLQIWSRDGKRLIRSIPVTERLDADRQGSRLLRLGDGYLLSAGDLVYVPDDAAKPAWRFSLRIDTGERQDWNDIQATGFGVPRIIGSRLLVTGYSGGIFIFQLPLEPGQP